MTTLEAIQKGVALALETDVAICPDDNFEDLGVDSLGVLMVLVTVASELGIEGQEQDLSELLPTIRSVSDVVRYVESTVQA